MHLRILTTGGKTGSLKKSKSGKGGPGLNPDYEESNALYDPFTRPYDGSDGESVGSDGESVGSLDDQLEEARLKVQEAMDDLDDLDAERESRSERVFENPLMHPYLSGEYGPSYPSRGSDEFLDGTESSVSPRSRASSTASSVDLGACSDLELDMAMLEVSRAANLSESEGESSSGELQLQMQYEETFGPKDSSSSSDDDSDESAASYDESASDDSSDSNESASEAGSDSESEAGSDESEAESEASDESAASDESEAESVASNDSDESDASSVGSNESDASSVDAESEAGSSSSDDSSDSSDDDGPGKQLELMKPITEDEEEESADTPEKASKATPKATDASAKSAEVEAMEAKIAGMEKKEKEEKERKEKKEEERKAAELVEMETKVKEMEEAEVKRKEAEEAEKKKAEVEVLAQKVAQMEEAQSKIADDEAAAKRVELTDKAVKDEEDRKAANLAEVEKVKEKMAQMAVKAEEKKKEGEEKEGEEKKQKAKDLWKKAGTKVKMVNLLKEKDPEDKTKSGKKKKKKEKKKKEQQDDVAATEAKLKEMSAKKKKKKKDGKEEKKEKKELTAKEKWKSAGKKVMMVNMLAASADTAKKDKAEEEAEELEEKEKLKEEVEKAKKVAAKAEKKFAEKAEKKKREKAEDEQEEKSSKAKSKWKKAGTKIKMGNALEASRLAEEKRKEEAEEEMEKEIAETKSNAKKRFGKQDSKKDMNPKSRWKKAKSKVAVVNALAGDCVDNNWNPPDHSGAPFIGTVWCEVVQCRNLKGMDKGGTSDPYVKLDLNGKQKRQTKSKKKDTNPKFGDVYSFEVKEATDKLTVRIWDKDLMGKDDAMGECEVDISTFAELGGRKEWFRLNPSEKQQVEEDEDIGEVELRMWRGSFLLKVVQARNLIAMDDGGTSDPFVEVTLDGDQKKKTKALKKTLNPAFDEQFWFELGKEEGLGQKLQFKLYDKDLMSGNDQMGQVIDVPINKLSEDHASLKWHRILNKPGKDVGTLTVKVCQAKNLPAVDGTGKKASSDPYVVLKTSGGKKENTKTKKKDLNPKWQENFAMKIKDLSETLFLTVMDKDALSADDEMCKIEFNVNDLAEQSNSEGA
jgi:hypothetical protein